MKRRDFVISSCATLAGTALLRATASAADKRPPRILLRSSWQTVNIGDIAHSPGVVSAQRTPSRRRRLPLAQQHRRRRRGDAAEDFPKLQFVRGAEAVKKAFAECDFLLHGSGPSLVAPKHVAQWRKETGKPYGVYGITLPSSVSKDDGTRHASLDDEGRACSTTRSSSSSATPSR